MEDTAPPRRVTFAEPSRSAVAEPIEVIPFLFPDVRARLPRNPDVWGLEGGSIVELQVIPGEPLEDQILELMNRGPPGSAPTHITLVGPLGSRELDDARILQARWKNVVWYLTPEVYANRGQYDLDGIMLKKLPG